MSQRIEEIEQGIQWRRGELGDDIADLQPKPRNASDWRVQFQVQFQERPITMIGVAFGCGVLISRSEFGRRRKSGHGAEHPSGSSGMRSSSNLLQGAGPAVERQKETWEVWDNMKGAFIGVAGNRLKDFFAEVLPDFEEQYRKAEREKKGPRSAGQTAAVPLETSRIEFRR